LNKLKILLIEDNLAIARQLIEFLGGHKWVVDYAQTGQLGVSLAAENIYDVVLLDLNLPDIDGLDVCQQIKQRAQFNIPILMLTARDAFEDKVRGFDQGADDYVTKPFEMRELVLRCQALARRHNLHTNKQIVIAELQLDLGQKTASRKGQALSLTNIDFSILSVLAQAYPQAVSRSVLMHKIWGDEPPESDALKSHIYSLRTALDKPFEQAMLVTITNVGYKLK
jgi:DNA-binding response OmpR family regulator